ncbi:hypothetical protein MASR2M12_04170 [Bacteroidales bacterium]
MKKINMNHSKNQIRRLVGLVAFSISAVLPLPASAQVTVNEYSVSNLSTIQDNYQKYEDWFELKNTTSSQLNLSGYYLSDNPSKPQKFQVPAGVVLAPGAHLKVWASGRGEYNSGHLHTNFKLAQTKDNQENILISKPDGTLIEDIPLQKTMNGHSWGRSPLGGDFVLYTNPTPGAANGSNFYSGYAPAPELSLAAGFYPSVVSVGIIAPEGFQIRYTTDGSEPTNSSTPYSGPVPITQTTILNARCFSTNNSILPGWLTFNTYFINTVHSLPVISVSAATLDDLLNGNQSLRPFGTFEYFNKNGQRTTIGYGEFNEHGQDSWVHPQRSIDYITRDECGYNYAIRDTIIPITPRNEFQRIILRAAGDDNYPGIDSSALLRDMFVQNTALMNGLHLDGRRGEKCVMYVNGQFWGVYGIREKVSDHDYMEYYYGQDKYHLYFLMLWGSTWAEYGAQAAFDDWNELHNFIKYNDMADQGNFEYVKSRLDYASLVDYIILNSFVVCSDWINWNVGWWRGTNPEGSQLKWRYILWDEDATFNHYINYTGVPGTLPNVNPCFPQNLTNDPEQHIFLFNRLRQNAEFDNYYKSRYIDLYNSVFKPENMIAYLDEIAGKMEPEMQKHMQRWGGTVAKWQSNVQKIRNFINARYNFLPEGLKSCMNLSGSYQYQFSIDPPELGHIRVNTIEPENFPWEGKYFGGTEVRLTAIPANGNIEFDHWEVPGHTIFPMDKAPIIQFVPQADAHIVAHFRHKLYSDSLIINEINYNSNASFDPGDWVEVFNPHPYPLDATGWVFKDEKDDHSFVFPSNTIIPAHGYLVICVNKTAFAQLFPDVENFIGDTGFGLSGSGELIRIYNKNGILIDHVLYDDEAPWPTEPDGGGPTLELIHPSLDNNLGENWISSPGHGTPGRINSLLVGKTETQAVAFKIRITPNPAGERTIVRFGDEQKPVNGRLYLYSGIGTQLAAYEIKQSTQWVLETANLKPGIYLIHFEDSSGTSTSEKLLK